MIGPGPQNIDNAKNNSLRLPLDVEVDQEDPSGQLFAMLDALLKPTEIPASTDRVTLYSYLLTEDILDHLKTKSIDELLDINKKANEKRQTIPNIMPIAKDMIDRNLASKDYLTRIEIASELLEITSLATVELIKDKELIEAHELSLLGLPPKNSVLKEESRYNIFSRLFTGKKQNPQERLTHLRLIYSMQLLAQSMDIKLHEDRYISGGYGIQYKRLKLTQKGIYLSPDSDVVLNWVRILPVGSINIARSVLKHFYSYCSKTGSETSNTVYDKVLDNLSIILQTHES